MLFQKDPGERFGEDVGKHVPGGHVKEGDFLILNAFPDEMISGVNMLCSCMVFRVLRKGFGTLVVDMKRNRIVWAESEFRQDVAEPKPLLTRVGEGLVLRLCAGQGDGGLFSGLPGDGPVTNPIGVS
jgi:hypothetical protein